MQVNFNHVNKIEARYKLLRLNVKLSEILLLRLRATFHTLPLFFCERKFYARTPEKITRQSGRFPFNKNSGLKFRKLHVLNGTVHSGCTDPTQATARFVIVASQHTDNYALEEKSKYCLYPKEDSTVEKGRWKTKGGGVLFRVESL